MNPVQLFAKQFNVSVTDCIQIGKRCYSFTDQQKSMWNELSRFQLAYAGTYLGNSRKPSVYLLNYIAQRTDQKVMIDDKSAWLFLCGRDIFKKGIVRLTADPGSSVIVVNQQHEVLGYGTVANKQKIAVSNCFDIGDFLRRESRQRRK